MMADIFLKVVTLVLCHLVGDYVLQTDFIAKTKGTNWYHLFVHCALYILPFIATYGFVWQSVIVFVTHFTIDALKARRGKISYQTDQMLHYLIVLIYFV
jgi:hypothetical protein